MATALQSLRWAVRRFAQSRTTFRSSASSIGRRQAFSTVPARWDAPKDEDTDPRIPAIKEKIKKLLRDETTDADGDPIDNEDLVDLVENLHGRLDKAIKDLDPEKMQQELEKRIEAKMERKFRFQDEEEEIQPRKRKLKQTFMNMGEHEPWEEDTTMPDDDDDIPTLAHQELEQHREMRHYARLAAWEMPLLSKLAKPFVPPTSDMPLRFRYTTYMGEKHPAEKKVVVEFSPSDLPNLTDIQRDKLKKLVGMRYNPEEDIVKMSCDMFDTQNQNKRYLGDTIDTLLQESRTGDMFEDIPLDLRHHKFDDRPVYPKQWYMTEERRAELEQYRQQLKMKDEKLAIEGKVVDGVKQIESAMAKLIAERGALPEMAMAGKGKAKRVTVRR